MNIYIYGDKSFVKEIYKILDKNRIRHRLSQLDKITTINTLESLTNAIFSNPKDIFLIDHKKISQKNFFTKWFKFLNPKGAVEKSFLEDNGIGDLSVDDISDVAKHIIKRLEAMEQEQGSCNIYQKTGLDYSNNGHVEVEQEIDTIPRKPIEELDVGGIMDELTGLDDIKEEDIIAALADIEGLNITKTDDTIKVVSKDNDTATDNQTVEVDASNIDEISKLLEQLMNNKTLEISIKVKS